MKSPFVLGVYGKVGKSKGTAALLNALAILKKNDYPVILQTHWGGRDLKLYTELTEQLGVENLVQSGGFIPHWHIPDFIRSCDAVLFLENRFRITFHQPSVPLEVLSCGRPVITTTEVANKAIYSEMVSDGNNAFVIRGKVTGESVASEIVRAHKQLCQKGEMSLPQLLPATDTALRVRVYHFMEMVQHHL